MTLKITRTKAPIYVMGRHREAFTPLYNKLCDYLDDKMITTEKYGGTKSEQRTDPRITFKITNLGSKMFKEVIIVEIERLVGEAGGKVKWFRKKRNKFWVVEINMPKSEE